MTPRPGGPGGLVLPARFASGVAWNVGSVGVLGVAGILAHVVIATFRGPEALGVFNQVFAVYIFASQLCTGGVQLSALALSAHHQADARRLAEIAGSALLAAAGLSALVCGSLWLARGVIAGLLQSEGVEVGLALATPSLFFFALNKVLLNVLNGVDRMRAFAVFQALRFLLILAGVVAIVALGLPGEALAGSLTFAEAALFAAMGAFVCARLFVPRLPAAPWGGMGEQLRFGALGFLGGALFEVNTRVDVLMLGLFGDDRTVGIYSFAAILAEGLGQLSFVVRRSVDPLLGLRFAAGEREKIAELAASLRRRVWPAMALACLAAAALYPLGVRAIAAPEFSAGWGVFALLAAGLALNAGYRPFTGILLLGKRPGSQTLYVGILVLLNVAGNLILIPPLGMYGAALATACVFVAEAALIALFARALFDVRL